MATQFEVRKVTLKTGVNEEILVPLLQDRSNRTSVKVLYVDDLSLTTGDSISGYIRTTSDNEYFKGYSKIEDESYFELENDEILKMSNNTNPKMMKVGSITVNGAIGTVVTVQFIIDKR